MLTRLRSERTLPLRLILIASGLALAGLFFIWIWFEVAEGEALAIDRFLIELFRAADDPGRLAGPNWLEATLIDITTLGGRTVLTLIVIGATGFMVFKRAYRIAALIVGATLSGSMIVDVLKQFLNRPRPEIVDQLVHETSMSFPSGHAANSAVVYLTIAVLFLRIEPQLSTRLFALIFAIVIVTVIGMSRVALGVHWPSDVLAGWLFGTAWACLWALIVKLPGVHLEGEVLPGHPRD